LGKAEGSMVKRVLSFFKRKLRQKRLEEKAKALELKLLEGDIKLGVFSLYHEKLAYKMVKEAMRLERRRRREVRAYVV
jgi:hypothetical protein